MIRPEHKLSELIRCKTVSCGKGPFPQEEFDKLAQALEALFPLVHGRLERERIDGFTLLYRWKGGKGKPALLLAHQDVVPADEEGWLYPPFSGELADGYVWGRGAFDMKCQLVAILQAAEELLAQGFTPNRDVYFCFTHNEEAADETGAKAAAKLLAERGIRFSVAIDEGGYAFCGADYGMGQDGIFVALCEKGYADIEITAEDEGGHASTPKKNAALARVCRAIAAIEGNPPKPSKNAATDALIRSISRCLPIHKRFGLLRSMAKRPGTNALVRSTIAPTMIQASCAPNVLPSTVRANLNARLLPGDSPKALLAHCERVTKGLGVRLRLVKANPAMPVAPAEGEEYERILRALRAAMPALVPVPGIMTGATDSRFFAGICDAIYRASPFSCAKEVLGSTHGVNERVSIASLGEGIAFFRTLLGSF
ncbi:MAG: M20/M25/M40 family metallo-hydrolase [Christensenellales bacterium]|jgi:carboxypeptidase PM20D1